MTAALLFALAGTAQAAPPVAAQPAFRCEAPAGTFEMYDLATDDNFLSGRIRLANPYAQTKWYPAAGLIFVLPGSHAYAGVQVFQDPDHPKEITVGIRRPHDDMPAAVARLPITSTADIYARLNDGTLTVGVRGQVGPIEKTVKLKANAVGRTLMCSSGTFEFENIPAVTHRWTSETAASRK